MNSLQKYASTLCDATKWHGNHDQNSKTLVLKAGCISMIYENGNLRYLSVGNHEVLRMIYPALRDKEWNTIDPVISGEEFNICPDWFSIKYNCQYNSNEINFSARYTIEGKKDNSLILTLKGEAMSTFEKNRIGFCVLHPIEGNKGENCTIIHSNGTREELSFPFHISPHQPFLDIKSMRWKRAEAVYSLDFFGDIFETEDHRNWTDASFKTYCTPLNLPFPAKLEKGSRISQRIEFKAEVKTEVEKKDSGPVSITVFPEKRIRLPAIGIGHSTRQIPLTYLEIKTLRKIRFDHYRIDLYLFNSEWKTDAEVAAAESEKLGYPFEFALFFDDNFESQLDQFINWIKKIKTDIKLISLYHQSYSTTPDLIIKKISPILKKTLPGVMLGCGTNSNFAQLNRNRPHSDLFDNLTYSIHPQEHASDNITLVENLQAQRHTVESAKHFSNGKGIWVSPVTIQRRFNANKENFEPALNYVSLPDQVDSRSMSLFCASWTAASIKYLSETVAEGITFYETVGERGIIQGDFPSRWPGDFKSVKDMIFPVFHLFKFVLNNKAFEVMASRSSDPLTIDILALSQGTNLKIVLMNFTGDIQSVRLKDISGDFSMKQLHAGNFAEAVSELNWYQNTSTTQIGLDGKLLLQPFSLSFIEGKVLT